MNLFRPFAQGSNALRRTFARATALALVAVLASCGFAMRGSVPLPFDSLYLTVAKNSQFGANLRRAIRATSPHTQIVDAAKGADAQLIQISNDRTLREVSLNAQGRVEQYELTVLFVFRLIDSKGNALLPDTTLVSTRELPYNDQLVQAKQSEIDRLFDTMQNSLVDRIVRRITSPEVQEATEKYRSDKSTAPASGSQIDPEDHRLDPNAPPQGNRPQDDILPWNQTTITPARPNW